MTQNDIAFRMDELRNDVEKVDSLQKVLLEVIFQRQDMFALDECEWAFVLLGDLTFKLKNELTELTDAAFKNMREGA